jgi:hypothetical protein
MLNTFKSVAKGTVIYGFANVSIKLLGIILIPIYTNYKYLSKADFGVLGVLDITYWDCPCINLLPDGTTIRNIRRHKNPCILP